MTHQNMKLSQDSNSQTMGRPTPASREEDTPMASVRTRRKLPHPDFLKQESAGLTLVDTVQYGIIMCNRICVLGGGNKLKN